MTLVTNTFLKGKMLINLPTLFNLRPNCKATPMKTAGVACELLLATLQHLWS